MPIGNDTLAWRGGLPHLEKGERTYFVTFGTYNRRVLPPDERDVAIACIVRGHMRDFFLHAAVVMPDHVHVLFTPFDHVRLSNLMQQVKGVSAHEIARLRGKRTVIWQHEYFDRIVRREDDLRAKAEYI